MCKNEMNYMYRELNSTFFTVNVMKFIVVYKWKKSLFISNVISFADNKAINLKIRRKEIGLC